MIGLEGEILLHNRESGEDGFKLVFKQSVKRSRPILGCGDGKGWDKEHQRCEFHMPIQKEIPIKFRIEFVNVSDPQDILWVEKFALNIEPIKLSFLDLPYRHTIYGTQDLSEIRASIEISVAPETLEKGALRIRLISQNSEKFIMKQLFSK